MTVLFAGVHEEELPLVVEQGTQVSFLIPVESQTKSERVVSQLLEVFNTCDPRWGQPFERTIVVQNSKITVVKQVEVDRHTYSLFGENRNLKVDIEVVYGHFPGSRVKWLHTLIVECLCRGTDDHREH